MLNGAQRRGVWGSSPGRQKLALLRREAGSEAPQTKFAAVVLAAEPPSASAAELKSWQDAVGQMQSSLEAAQAGILAGEVGTSLRLSSELLRVIEDVRINLSTIAHGTQLPSTLFDSIDNAWAELGKAMA